MTTTACPVGPIAAADDIVGPTRRTKRAIFAVTGTMTAGTLIVEYQFPGDSTNWYPGDNVTPAKLTQLAANNGTDYGYVTELSIPGGAIARVRADDAFVGTITAYLAPVSDDERS